MGIALTILGIPLAILGAYLIALFLMMRFRDGVEECEIQGFQQAKNKGRALPFVHFEEIDEEEQTVIHQVAVRSIWNISYLISPPIEREIIQISGVRGKNPRVFGYLGLLIGTIALIPAFIGIGLNAGELFFVTQMMYGLIMIAIILGGWIALKIIQKS